MLASWPTVESYGKRNITRAMMITTVDFQVAQCYFAGAIQIAALVYTERDYLLIRWVACPKLLDAGLLFALATNGFAPTILTLTLIAKYGRQSWYLIFLSSFVFILATGTLAASSTAWHATTFDPVYGVLQECGDSVASELTTVWCGLNNNLLSDSGHNPTSINKVIWVMWAHSLLWLMYCIAKKIRTSNRFLPALKKLGSVCQPRLALNDRFTMGILGKCLGWGLFTITWSLSLGYQLWLYAVILFGSITNYTWSFGQILAIVIWTPCIVELINLEISRYS